MENASKALLIAASVLIAIALIAIGIKILSSTSGVTKQVDQVSSSLEASIFNSQFTKYEGERKGSDVKALLRLIKQTNLTLPDSKKIVLDVAHGGGVWANQNVDNILNGTAGYSIESNQIWEVEIKGTDSEGRINKVEIYYEDL